MSALVRHRRRLAAILLTAATALSVASIGQSATARGAERIDAGTLAPVTGPRLAGDRVVWAEAGAGGGFALFERGLEGGPADRLFATAGPRAVSLSLEASSEQVVLHRTLFDQSAQPLFGPREPVSLGSTRIPRGGSPEQISEGCGLCVDAVDVSGSIAIYPAATQRNVFIRDFGATSTTQEVGGVEAVPRVAGRYAAWAAGRDVVVYDTVDRREVFRVAGVGRSDGAFGNVDALDIQSDGTIVFAAESTRGGQAQNRLAWASPEEPFVHDLGVGGPVGFSVRIADDQVVYSRTRTASFDRRLDLGTNHTEIGVVPLSGRARTVVRPAGPDFDFADGRVGWQRRACRGVQIGISDLASLLAAPRLDGPRRCRLQLRSRPRVRRGGLRIPFSCVGFEADCFVQAISVRTGRGYTLNGRRVRKGTKLNVRGAAPRPAAVLRVPLTKAGRRLLRGMPARRLVLRAIVGDSEVVERRSRRVVVR